MLANVGYHYMYLDPQHNKANQMPPSLRPRKRGGRGFDPLTRQTKVFKTGNKTVPLGAQDYGDSPSIGPLVSG